MMIQPQYSKAALRDVRQLRAKSLGFTLIELMVAMAIGLFVVAATLLFVTHQSKLLEHTQSDIERDRDARMALDLLIRDLRNAGLGVGYLADGQFAGLRRGDFQHDAGASFQSNGRSITLDYGQGGPAGQYTVTTDDLGIRFANGNFRSVIDWTPGTVEICGQSAFKKSETVLLISQDGLASRTGKLTMDPSSGPCSKGFCAKGCDTFTYDGSDAFLSDTSAANASFYSGEVVGGFQDVTWFVFVQNGAGTLRRVALPEESECSDADDTCGQLVSPSVDSLQVRVSEWDADSASWVDATDGLSDQRRRIRVDLELGVRSRSASESDKEPAVLELSGECLPACGTKDWLARRVMRTSVEIRNSGRLTFEGFVRK